MQMKSKVQKENCDQIEYACHYAIGSTRTFYSVHLLVSSLLFVFLRSGEIMDQQNKYKRQYE